MNARPWLISSLAVNAALAGLITWAALARRGGPAPGSVIQQLTHRTLRVRTTIQESVPVAVAVAASFHWRDVESADYRVYMANLRAIGCPERTVRDIVVADLDQLFIQRMREQFYPLHHRVWWLLANEEQAKELGNTFEKQWEALMDERKEVLRELIGTEEPYAGDEIEERAAGERARWAHTLGFLPPEKQEQVLTVRKTAEQAIHDVWATDRDLTREERQQREQQQREIEAARDRQLAGLLTPEELAEYKLRTSSGADVRYRLSRLEFSEDELRLIARTLAGRQEAEAELRQDTPEVKKQREAFARRAEAELKAALGEARFADYQRASNDRFEQISQVVERHGLQPEKATAVYDFMDQADAQARLVREDLSRTVEERGALLQAIRDETERSVRTELGARAFTTYQKRGGEGWLPSLVAPPK